ncbi:MAG TPA: hypothetical protein VFJ14_11465, partial [Nocardioidaceae bacterium]|nr:hypothetical protein [Nocardioidaceae bacterium]
ARAVSERGEVVVRRRDDGAVELRVNGVFVMDTAQTDTERLLARAALDTMAHPHRVLVGGLGLGFTVRELLDDSRVHSVVVAEIEPAVVDWMRAGTIPGADLVCDPRVEIVVADVRDVVAEAAAHSLDAVVLDVDNGPGYLVHEQNAAVYAAEFLTACRSRLRLGGQLTVWSAAPTPALAATMTDVFGDSRTRSVAVDLQGRAESYWLLSTTA